MEAVLGCKTSNEWDVRQTFKLVHGIGIPPFPGLHLSIPSGPGRWHIVLMALHAECSQGHARVGCLCGAATGPVGIAGWIVGKGLGRRQGGGPCCVSLLREAGGRPA